MFLSDNDIEKAVKKGEIMLKPFDKKRLQPVSYDILLGNKFVISEEHVSHVVDPMKKIFAQTREVHIKDGHEFVLHPGTSVLGTSKEFFGSDYYLIQVGGKSSLARVGLMIHNTAGIINPGHFLHITFEISNQSTIPIILRPGMEVAQLTFSMLSSLPKNSYKKLGRYAQNNWNHFVTKPTPKKKRKK